MTDYSMFMIMVHRFPRLTLFEWALIGGSVLSAVLVGMDISHFAL
jgi:hypothetical protein